MAIPKLSPLQMFTSLAQMIQQAVYPANAFRPIMQNLVALQGSAAVDPDVDADFLNGYRAFKSFWTNTVTGDIFMCTDDTNGAAVWTPVAPSIVKQPVFRGLEAEGTSNATTSVMQYGVNVYEVASATDYAAKLPQPKTGRSTTIINKSLVSIKLYPSNVGGQINNLPIDSPAIIPPDGKEYVFTCIENPLPGAWVYSAPAIGQYDSGEITANTTTNAQVILGVDTAVFQVSSSPSIPSAAYSPSINTPLTTNGYTYRVNAGFNAQFKPNGIGNNWNSIAKIKIYTNISSDLGGANTPLMNLSRSATVNQYEQGTDPLDGNNWLNTNSNSAGFFPSLPLTNVVSGTVPAPGVTANIGDPGTLYGIFTEGVDFFYPDDPGIVSSIVGDRYIGPGTFVFGNNTYPTDDYVSILISCNLQPMQVLTGVKYRFFIEYN